MGFSHFHGGFSNSSPVKGGGIAMFLPLQGGGQEGDGVSVGVPLVSSTPIYGYRSVWQRGIKGDFKNMLGKSPLTPLYQRGV